MELFLKIVLVALPSYLLGAIPASYIMGRTLRGIDLREHGSGNLGAANAFRVLGTKAAVPVLLFDVGKGFIAVEYISRFGGDGYGFMLFAAFIVILGHNYSVFVRFSGGKGVGTTTGAFLGLVPQAVVLCIALWIVLLLITRIVSIASMASAAFLPAAILIADYLFANDTHPSFLALAVLVAVFVIAKHRSNISRLREGKEKRLF